MLTGMFRSRSDCTVLILYYKMGKYEVDRMLSKLGRIDMWLILGFVAQVAFFMRFLIQWLASEQRKTSHIPVSFWYFSIVGSVGLFIYACHIKDPVFIVGQSLGFIIYIRNIMLIRQNPKEE